MDRRGAADHRMLGDADMSAHHHVVRHDDMVPDRAVMRDMDHRHQHAILADAGDPAAGNGTSVDRAVLPHQSAGTDFTPRRLTLVFEVLRRQTHGAEREQLRVLADARVTLDDDVRDQFRAGLENHVWTDGAERSDLNPGSEFRPMRDNGCWVNTDPSGAVWASVGHCIHDLSVPWSEFLRPHINGPHPLRPLTQTRGPRHCHQLNHCCPMFPIRISNALFHLPFWRY